MSEKIPSIVCVDCDRLLEFPGHKEVNMTLLKSMYVNELRNAMYWQDIDHQFESISNFDNCDFSRAIEYIDNLMLEIAQHAAEPNVPKMHVTPKQHMSVLIWCRAIAVTSKNAVT